MLHINPDHRHATRLNHGRIPVLRLPSASSALSAFPVAQAFRTTAPQAASLAQWTSSPPSSPGTASPSPTAPTPLQPPGLRATKSPSASGYASGDSPVNPDALRRSLSHATAPKSPPHLGGENGLGNCPVLPPRFPVLKPLFLTGVNWSVEVRTPGQACQSECHLFKPCYTLGGVVPM